MFHDGILRYRISIHALLAESDPQDLIAKELALAFLSTLSLRRATLPLVNIRSTLSPDFYPRSPCGERLQQAITAEQTARISIHALLAESDSTTPAYLLGETDISIHALLAESDESA